MLALVRMEKKTVVKKLSKIHKSTSALIELLLFFRRGIALATLGGPIYAIGGLDDNSCFNDVERYDIESDCWSAVAPMNTPRGGVGSVALGVRTQRDSSKL